MPITESWPYVSKNHSIESEKHLKLKNLAVYWLQQQGFSLDDIEDEHTVYAEHKTHPGQTDIYAERGDQEVYIECETNYHGYNSLSMGGKLPAKDGKDVYVFTDEGIYLVEYEDRVWNIDLISSLPILDLRAFID